MKLLPPSIEKRIEEKQIGQFKQKKKKDPKIYECKKLGIMWRNISEEHLNIIILIEEVVTKQYDIDWFHSSKMRMCQNI